MALCAVLCTLGDPASARAQTCALPQPALHATHAFPTDAPNALPFVTTNAFPLISFDSPVSVRFAPGDSSRVFVADQVGAIFSIPYSQAADTRSVFLDITGTVDAAGNQKGLFDFVFHPNYASNGYLFAAYSAAAPNCAGGAPSCAKVVRYTRSASNPNVADPSTALTLLDWPHQVDFQFHYVASLRFGPDGYLYVSWGDGAAGTPAQDLSTLEGKILRIDPTGGTPYAIPPGNPFVGLPGARPEIYHYGFRHPWRFSFDRATGDLWIGDNGENLWEEVDYVPAGAPAGQNFGWWLCEGTHDYANFDCGSIQSQPPLFEYPHGPDTGSSVIAGYVYRGAAFPELVGQFVFADIVSGNIFAYSRPEAQRNTIALDQQIDSFGEAPDGELLLVRRFPGAILLLQRNPSLGASVPALLSQTGLFTDTAALTPAPGLVEYSVNNPLWSDRASKRRWIALPDGGVARFHATGDYDFPVRTALVKHFELPAPNGATRRLETRVFVRHATGWSGYTYRWNDAQTDAELLPNGLVEDVTVDFGDGPETQKWTYPSSLGCLSCHTAAAGRVLGVRTAQLNRNATYPGGTQNQLDAWTCGGLLEGMTGVPASYRAYPAVASAAATPQARMRAYLASNCSHCHQPGGPAPGDMDFRFSTLLGAMNLIGVTPQFGTLGVSGAQRIRPGSPDQSVLQLRQQTLDGSVRMPRGTLIPHTAAISTSYAWIRDGLSVLDSDSDGVADANDRCPRTPDPAQLDQGGFASFAPDGTGNACQCGDLNSNGAVFFDDVVQLRRWLAGLDGGSTAAADHKCPAADRSGRCVITDYARLLRAFYGLAPALGATCPAATEL